MGLKTMLSAIFNKPKPNAALMQTLCEAESLARSFGHDYIGVEHAFLALRKLVNDASCEILAKLPISPELFWKELEDSAKVKIDRPVPRVIRKTPRLAFVLKKARAIARSMGRKEITPSHFIAAVAYEGNSHVAHVFRKISEASNCPSPEESAAHHFATVVTRGNKIFQT
jgi:ATP-dependent Clp protease ATP-binding subunit ClpA